LVQRNRRKNTEICSKKRKYATAKNTKVWKGGYKMNGNLFTDVYAVKQTMFKSKSVDEELYCLRNSVNEAISDRKQPDKLQYLMFKVTNLCNSNCEYCTHAISRAKDEKKEVVPLEIIINTIEQAAELGVTAISVNGGEPLTRKDILPIIAKIIDCSIVPVLMTNGLLLPKMWDQLGATGLKYVIISFDSIVKEVYEKQRGVNFELALEGLEAALKMKEKYEDVEIHVSAVLTKDNQDDFIELVKFMSDKGIKVQVSPFHNYLKLKEDVSIHDREKIENLADTLLRMKKEGYLIASSVGFIKHLTSFFCEGKKVPDDYQCKVGYTNLFIDAYMNVKPCWSAEFKAIGKLGEKSLKEMWHSEKMENYRNKMMQCQCKGCWYMCTGEVSMLIDNLLD
jgi:MoaA/NifB/PqqE/SkfB family radical SAM enzyme